MKWPNEGEVFRGVRWLSLDELLDKQSGIELVAVESAVQRQSGVRAENA